MNPPNPPVHPSSLTIPTVAEALAGHSPSTQASEIAKRRAAVAMILRAAPAGGLETLFIQRAHHPLDPWSGHMAFPGGHQDPGDPSLEAAVRRETLEEIGLSLSENALLGRLHDISGGRLRPIEMSVSPFVYGLEGPADLRLNREEVADAVWVPLSYLAEPANVGSYLYPPDPQRREFPCYHYDRYTIWGMTYRMVSDFMGIFGVAIPHDWPLTDVE